MSLTLCMSRVIIMWTGYLKISLSGCYTDLRVTLFAILTEDSIGLSSDSVVLVRNLIWIYTVHTRHKTFLFIKRIFILRLLFEPTVIAD